MVNIKQSQQMISLITCDIAFGQDVCKLVLGFNIFDLNLGIKINSIKQPIKSNSVGSGNKAHCKASPLYDHLDHCFVAFKDIQHSFPSRESIVKSSAAKCIDSFPRPLLLS